MVESTNRDGLVVAGQSKDVLDFLCDFTEQLFCPQTINSQQRRVEAEPKEDLLDYVFQSCNPEKKPPRLTYSASIDGAEPLERPAALVTASKNHNPNPKTAKTDSSQSYVYCVLDPHEEEEEEEKVIVVRGSISPLMMIDSKDSFQIENIIVNASRAAVEKPAIPETHLYYSPGRPERRQRRRFCKI